MLPIKWANKHSFVESSSTLRTSSDIPIITLADLQPMLKEAAYLAQVVIDEYPEGFGCVQRAQHLLEELKGLTP